MLRIIVKETGKVVADGFGTPYPALDEAIRLVGELNNDGTVVIDGIEYDYDELDTEAY